MALLRSAAAVLLLLACAAGLVAPAFACSPERGYRVPTNLELAAQADVIVLARVRSGPDFEMAMRGGVAPFMKPRAAKFDIVSLIKGQGAPRRLSLEGAFVSKSNIWLSDWQELELQHPQGYAGGCHRSTFVMGSTVLLFLKRDKAGRLEVMAPAFARALEDVSGPQGRWVRAVREYIAVTRLTKLRWPPELERRRRAFQAMATTGDPDAAAIAQDMQRQTSMQDMSLLDEAAMERLIRHERRLDAYMGSLFRQQR